jgi:hypothetical protein
VERPVLPRPTWLARRAAHEARIDELVAPHLARRRSGERHPVEDFLFTYYSHRPAQLRRWHPGFGVVLADAPEYASVRGYRRVTSGFLVARSEVSERRDSLSFVRSLLAGTLSRPAQFGCLGMHEWAMVYRQSPSEVRHEAYPLRLGPSGTDRVVESHRVRCSHFDAYRFFTPPARPLNALSPSRASQVVLEQGGCLHANMDLYKWAYKLTPLVSSELVADCFELAREIRVLDMRASPYDLSSLGFSPVRVETPEGKAEYAAAQRSFATRADPLRRRLLQHVEELLDAD